MDRVLRRLALALCLCLPATACTSSGEQTGTVVPVTRWDHRPEAGVWTASAISALQAHGAALPELVPEDIETYCPGYETATVEERRAFWVGLLSALAKHESTWRPEASGGGGRWLGLLQIAPATAQGYGCAAKSPSALKNGAANLACGIRIMARTVARDGVIAQRDSRWRGIAADWAPFQKARKRAEMAAWTSAQPYCQG